jgi:negative regulator of sigma E activity
MIPQFLIARFGPKLAALIFYGGLALIAVAIVGVVYFTGRHDGKSGEVVKEQARTIDTIQKVGDANTNASAARVDDTRRQDQQKQELNDALKNASGGDDARRRTGCAILRQQGRDVSAIPACR